MITRRIGAGGMGVVYEAHDPELQRRVAIKVLRPGGPDSDAETDGKTRLLREAQAMAKLAHPNVVTVYDVGEHRDRVYVAMELIDGRTLGAWLAEEDRTVPEIVGAFIKAGRGLAAAHVAGLVHRDFKPDNVLVDRNDRVRVMDFGLVRAARRYSSFTPELDRVLDVGLMSSPQWRDSIDVLDSPLTQDGVVVGTPAYMAPEQHVGQEPTASSDQYGFCAALYEALCGQRPFASRGLRELALAKARMQLAELPAHAAPVAPALREVLLRGLQPQPGARYPTMDELLAVLEPWAARRARRAWPWAAAGLGIAGLSAWGLVGPHDGTACGSTQKLEGVWDEAVSERTHDAMLRAHPELPEGTWRRVSEGLDAYASQWQEAYERACQADPSAQHKDARLRCLQRRRAALSAVVEQLGEADRVRPERIVPMVIGLPAVISCEQGDGAEDGAFDDPEVRVRAETLQVEYTTVRTLRLAGRYEEALPAARDLLARVVELGHPTLEARTRLLIADLEHVGSDIDEAEEQMKRAFWVASAAGDDEMMVWAASSLVFFVSEDRADFESAMEWARHAQAALHRWNAPETFDYQRAQADLDGGLAVAHSNAGQYEEALRRFEHNYRTKRDLLGAEHPEVAGALMNFGICLAKTGHPQEAKERLEHALAATTEALGPEHPDLALNLSHLGSVYSELGDEERAAEHYDRALALYREAYGEGHPQVASVLDARGISEGLRGNFTGAMAYHRRALELYEAALGTEHPSVGRVLLNMGLAAAALRNYDEARDYFERARGIHLRTLGPDHNLTISGTVELGLTLLDLEQYERAQEALEKALAAQRRAVGSEHPLVAQALNALGWTHFEQGRFDEARALHQEALGIYEAMYGPEHPAVLRNRFDVAMNDLRAGRAEEAARQMESILPGMQSRDVDPALLADVKFHLAEAMVASGGDRKRAMDLAAQARDGFMLAGEIAAHELPDVELFIRTGGRSVGKHGAQGPQDP